MLIFKRWMEGLVLQHRFDGGGHHGIGARRRNRHATPSRRWRVAGPAPDEERPSCFASDHLRAGRQRAVAATSPAPVARSH